MHIGFDHYHKRKGSINLLNDQKRIKMIMDKLIFIVGSFSVVVFIPQLIMVWTQSNISGVSLTSWLGLFFASLFWIVYGHVHKTFPIFFMNILGGSIQLLVIIGILIHH